MDIPDNPTLGRPITSARELLQRFHYGHGDQVEKILEFANNRRLMDDDVVFLLVSILKGNEELIRCILLAIDGAERVIDNSQQAGKDLRALEQNLIAQIEAAAARAAGRLNLAADRLSTTVAKVDQLCGGMDSAARCLTQAEGVLTRAVEIEDGKHTLDRLIDQIRRQALADLRGYHAEVVAGLAYDVGRQARVLHVYGIVGLVAIALIFVAWQFKG